MEVLLGLVPKALAQRVGGGGARVGTAESAREIYDALRRTSDFTRAVRELTDLDGPAAKSLGAARRTKREGDAAFINGAHEDAVRLYTEAKGHPGHACHFFAPASVIRTHYCYLFFNFIFFNSPVRSSRTANVRTVQCRPRVCLGYAASSRENTRERVEDPAPRLSSSPPTKATTMHGRRRRRRRRRR